MSEHESKNDRKENEINNINEAISLLLSRDARRIKKYLINYMGQDSTIDLIKSVIASNPQVQILTSPKRLVMQHSSLSSGHKAYMDLIDLTNGIVLPNGWLLTVMDHYSRYGWVRWIPNKIASTILQAFKSIPEHGYIYWYIADRGEEWSSVESYLGGKLRYARDKNGTAPIERFNRTILEKINLLFNGEGREKWKKKLGSVVETYNNTEHSSTKDTPLNIWLGAESQYKPRRQMWGLKKGDYVRLVIFRGKFSKISRSRRLGDLHKIVDIDNDNAMWQLDDGKWYRNKEIQPVKVRTNILNEIDDKNVESVLVDDSIMKAS